MATSGHGPGVAVVALLASAGGLEALSTVLRDLPPDFPAAVVVQQHLGGHTSVLPTILGRLTGRSVGWAREGQTLQPGQVVVCPPGMLLELTPDGRCRLQSGLNHGTQGSDVLLTSVASSYGPRGAAVVLSGSGHDGAAGTVTMKRAGAIVIAESPSTARYPSMPIAAARAGADLVLDIDEIGQVLSSIVAGAPLPKPRESAAQAPVDDDAGVATYDVLDRLAPKISTNTAAARGELARLRAAELQRRRQELTVGIVATPETVAMARRRARESRSRAQLAHQAAEEASTRDVRPRHRG
ncbi:MAG TPA: chemotaxis protein CheB [Mycobacterium sp.]|nr:chemotaxis protein CheB [Mycobacterium sp.]